MALSKTQAAYAWWQKGSQAQTSIHAFIHPPIHPMIWLIIIDYYWAALRFSICPSVMGKYGVKPQHTLLFFFFTFLVYLVPFCLALPLTSLLYFRLFIIESYFCIVDHSLGHFACSLIKLIQKKCTMITINHRP